MDEGRREFLLKTGKFLVLSAAAAGAWEAVGAGAPPPAPAATCRDWGADTCCRPQLGNVCAASPCVQVCPVGATFESPDGVVLVDKTYCLGCRYCVQACPYRRR